MLKLNLYIRSHVECNKIMEGLVLSLGIFILEEVVGDVLIHDVIFVLC